jgi:hypothetical protein
MKHKKLTKIWFSWIVTALAAGLPMPLSVNCVADDSSSPPIVPFDVKAEVVLKELNTGFCWFHPRVAAIPGAGKDGRPAVLMTIQKHLVASDHYSGMYFLRTDDMGKTWTGPT